MRDEPRDRHELIIEDQLRRIGDDPGCRPAYEMAMGEALKRKVQGGRPMGWLQRWRMKWRARTDRDRLVVCCRIWWMDPLRTEALIDVIQAANRVRVQTDGVRMDAVLMWLGEALDHCSEADR